MAEPVRDTVVGMEADELFAFLSDIENLPTYFSRMKEASPAEGEAVHVVATSPDGEERRGEAWFRVLRDAHRLEWGSEGPNDYSGALDLDPLDGDRCKVTVSVHTVRVGASEEVDRSLEETLANIEAAARG